MAVPLRTLYETRENKQGLWPLTLPHLRLHFNLAVEALNGKHFGAHLYALRHGGASDDLLSRRRSLEQVKARGRSKADENLRRYAKATRLQREMNKMVPNITQLGQNVELNFNQVLTAANTHAELPFSVPPELRARCGPMAL